jgi:hypothetical protein
VKRLERIKNLNNNVSKNESELKLEYILLMRERNVYFEKLKMIQGLGENNGWEDETGML